MKIYILISSFYWQIGFCSRCGDCIWKEQFFTPTTFVGHFFSFSKPVFGAFDFMFEGTVSELFQFHPRAFFVLSHRSWVEQLGKRMVAHSSGGQSLASLLPLLIFELHQLHERRQSLAISNDGNGMKRINPKSLKNNAWPGLWMVCSCCRPHGLPHTHEQQLLEMSKVLKTLKRTPWVPGAWDISRKLQDTMIAHDFPTHQHPDMESLIERHAGFLTF